MGIKIIIMLFKLLLISLAALSVFSCLGQPAQSGTIISSSSYGLYFRGYNGGEVAFDNNGKSKLGNYDLESIRGQLYWSNEFHPAKLYLKENKYLGEFDVKYEMLNMVFYVKYADQSDMKVIDQSYIEKVEFLKNVNGFERPIFVNSFFHLSAKTKGLPNSFLQELLKGIFSIYKMNKVLIRYQDSLFGSIKKPFLVDQSTYFIFYKGEFKEIKKLSIKNIAQAFPSLRPELAQLEEMKINWNDEKEVVLKLADLNSELKKKED